MSDQGWEMQSTGNASVVCGVCGTPNVANDRFCAECGAVLPAPVAERGTIVQTVASPESAVSPPATGDRPQEPALWLFAATPAAVLRGGLLLLLLAVALLVIGQLDHTGTIVIISFFIAPIALLILAIGIVRAVLGRGGEGG